ncbi:hypothetical protein FHS43_002116 [Streptosporangium becharense]|uniref:Alpha amylase inhibitor n=1 Tax=Streptosporangium becharense TaxID=1816182 RepID=A0A7W9IBC1_9ACTN|nr:hypothetical protein [Streptosporangium becharense]MBB2910853.1 hypothetical protein [Streptosporangium becharense]MBB5817548.1 hypothetical protein [Streptosporangium becharense]
MWKRLLTITAVAAGMTAGSVGAAVAGVPGSAAGLPAASMPAAGVPLAAAGTAPACIKRWVNNSWSASARNDCGKNMYVKIIINNGDDSGCRGLTPGATMTHRHATGSYDKTVTC